MKKKKKQTRLNADIKTERIMLRCTRLEAIKAEHIAREYGLSMSGAFRLALNKFK